MAQKDSKKSAAKKLKSTKKSVAKKVKSKKKGSKSELKKLVAKAEKRAAKKPAAVENGAEARQAGPVRVRRTPATTLEAPSSTWNVNALRAHARTAGVVGYSRMKKDDLLAHLGVH